MVMEVQDTLAAGSELLAVAFNTWGEERNG